MFHVEHPDGGVIRNFTWVDFASNVPRGTQCRLSGAVEAFLVGTIEMFHVEHFDGSPMLGCYVMALRLSFKAPSPRESVNRTIGVVGYIGQ
jgi:hypothetical protein